LVPGQKTGSAYCRPPHIGVGQSIELIGREGNIVRKRVSVIVVKDDQVLGFRAEDPYSGKKYVFIPGGLIEKSESPEEAAVRETKEETGYEIALDPDFQAIERYKFEWDGRLHDCQTWYFRGKLSPSTQTPSVVSDAPYHQGVIWIPIQDISSVFGYHNAILRPIKQAIDEYILKKKSER
jgi:8-oxo-dGTP pyrophosphatase MutT (NUDIX family)